jgi:DNA-directed RNA polymerase subunit RPC12/RpoP
MYCRKCGAQIPDDSEFCPKCGAPQNDSVSRVNVTSSAGTESEEILKEMKCPNCGAPLNPAAGEAMVVCQYCGTSISLGSNGWSKVRKHFILDVKVDMKENAEKIARDFLDSSILHRHLFEKSTLQKLELSFIPYWIIEAGYSAQYKFKKEQAQPGGFVGMGFGGRGGFAGPTVNFQTVIESGTDVNEVKYPVIAVENMNQYQPPDYVFDLSNEREIQPKDMSGPVKLMNGTIGEEKARLDGKIRIQQWEIRRLQKRVHGFLSAEVNVDIASMYLAHIPVWTLSFQHKNDTIFLLIDGHNGRVMEEVKQ